MDGGVPGKALELSCHVDEAVDIALVLIALFQLVALLQCLVQGDAQLIRNELCDLITEGILQVHDPPNVPDHTLGSQRAERDDLHDVVLAVLLRHVVNDFLSPLILKVHVDIRHGDTLGI